MASPKTRWECPNGCGAVMGPRRPRKDDVRRYCLPCSEESGRLVERVAPVVEKERKAAAERAAKKRAARAARIRERKNKYTARGPSPVMVFPDAAGVEHSVNIPKEVLRVAKRMKIHKRLGSVQVIRRTRSRGPNGIGGLCYPHGAPNGPTGWRVGEGRAHITVSVYPGASYERLCALIAHEVAHIRQCHHKKAFRIEMARTISAAYPGRCGRLPVTTSTNALQTEAEERMRAWAVAQVADQIEQEVV
jgi:hypothetical protein